MSWKPCPSDVNEYMRYRLEDGGSLARKTSEGCDYCTIIGDFGVGRGSSYHVKIASGDGSNIFVGLAPYDIDQNANYNFERNGCYLNCGNMKLYAGYPKNVSDESYGDMWGYAGSGAVIGVHRDDDNNIRFSVNGNMGPVAYEDVSGSLVPCVIIRECGNAVCFC